MKRLILPLVAVCLAPLAAPAAIRINEVHYNVNGPDENYEFIELKSTTNGVESLAGITLVLINNALSDDGVLLNPGEILEVLDLSALSTGTNGLLLLGNGYTDSPRGGPWAGAVDPATNMGDPVGLGDSDIKTNSGFTMLLVRNYDAVKGPKGADIDQDPYTGPGASAVRTGNGFIDWKQATPPANALKALWADADVIDSIGTLDYSDSGDPVDVSMGIPSNPAVDRSREPYLDISNSANINRSWSGSQLGLRDPDTFARQLGNDTPNNALSYYGGKLYADAAPTDVLYRLLVRNGSPARWFGPGNLQGQVTPGRPNLAATLPATDFVINEVGLNPPGNSLSDANRFQYVEILNKDGQSRSLNGYTLLVIDSFDDSANSSDPSPGVGKIVEEWDLSNLATGTNGLLLLGDGFSPAYTPYQDLVSIQTAVGDPSVIKNTLSKTNLSSTVTRTISSISSSWGRSDLRFKDGFTLLLVKGYVPPSTSTTDKSNTSSTTTTNLMIRDVDSSPEDGILDSQPWTSISDQVGFTQAAKTTIGRSYASAADLRSVMSPFMTSPDNLSRKLGTAATANSATSWYGGSYPGGSSPSNIGFEFEPAAIVPPGATHGNTWFGGFRGAGTPGLPNLDAPINPVSAPIASSIRINEVMINPTDASTNGDANREYIELASTNQGIAYLDGLWILVLNMSGDIGKIQTAFPLAGATTGPNGLVLFGDGYDDTNGPYSTVDGALPPDGSAYDPPVGLEQNNLPNNGCAILLVRGIKGPITLDASGKPTGDLDPGNLGTLLAPSDYTDELIDSIVTSPRNPGAGYGWVDTTAFIPHHLARYPANFTPSNADSWYYGQVSQTADALPSTDYIGSFVGLQGAVSPGRPNHSAPKGPVTVGAVLLNEVNLNPAGSDGNFEFVELRSVSGTARSLNRYTLIALDNQASNTGGIRHAWSLDGLSTGTNGLFVLGNRYPILGQNPWSKVMRFQTKTGDIPGREGLDTSFSDAVLASESNNLNLCLVLVRDFNKYIDFDIDQKVGSSVTGNVDSPGDGQIEYYPWAGDAAGIHDSINLRDYLVTSPAPIPQPATYPWDGWTYGFADLSTTFFPNPSNTPNVPVGSLYYHPETVARFLNENTPNLATAWYGGDLKGGLTGNDASDETYISTAQDPTHPPLPIGFQGRLTPGQPNLLRSATADPDQDGLPNLIEQALNTNPTDSASNGPLPTPSIITVGTDKYLSFTYPRILSGTAPVPFPYAAEAYVYVVETSPDLQTWTPDTGIGTTALISVGSPVPNLDKVTENFTVRLPASVTTAPGRHYIRLRINRR